MTMTTSSSDERVPASSPSIPDSPPASATECTNCGAPITDTYCGTCGQRAANRVVPLWQVTNEFLEDLFDLDLRILRTFPAFFFRPGHLTVEYVRGRRREYIRPLRLYLFSSFLLFTVLTLVQLNGWPFSAAPSAPTTQAEVEAAQNGIDAARAELETLRSELTLRAREGVPTNGDEAPPPPADGSPRLVQDPGTRAGLSPDDLARIGDALTAAEASLVPTATRSASESSEAPSTLGLPPSVTDDPLKLARILENPNDFAEDVIGRAPYLMFVLVPTFALLLKLLYVRRRRLYLEHLIFTLHVHALAFIAFALSAGLGTLGWGTSAHVDRWLAVSPFAYLVVAMYRVYGQSLLVTAGKAFALLLAYGIILVGAVVGLVLASIALM